MADCVLPKPMPCCCSAPRNWSSAESALAVPAASRAAAASVPAPSAVRTARFVNRELNISLVPSSRLILRVRSEFVQRLGGSLAQVRPGICFELLENLLKCLTNLVEMFTDFMSDDSKHVLISAATFAFAARGNTRRLEPREGPRHAWPPPAFLLHE